jgi:FkbM family methyltransferase
MKKIFFDVGANFGYHSILFSKEVSGKVFAFEPQIQNYNLLQKNLEQNNITNVVTYNLGCGDENCDIKMPVIEDSVNWINMGDFTPNWSIYFSSTARFFPIQKTIFVIK